MWMTSEVDGVYGCYDLDQLCNHGIKSKLRDDLRLYHDVKAKEV